MARRRRVDEGWAVGGAVVLLIGLLFLIGVPQLADLGAQIGDFLARFWPILLIIAGLVMMLQAVGTLRR